MPTPAQAAAIKSAIDGGTAYIATGDYDELAGPTVDVVASLALALPPPAGPILAATLQSAGTGIKATKAHMSYGAKMAARFLPIGVSAKVLKTLREAPTDYWERAGKDKLVQFIKKDLPAPARMAALGIADAAKFDTDLSYRFADALQQRILDAGGSVWQAALVNAAVSYATAIGPADWAHAHEMHDLAAGKPGAYKTESLQQVFDRRLKETNAVVVSAKDAKKAPAPEDTPKGTTTAPGSGSAAVPLLIGGLALVALAR